MIQTIGTFTVRNELSSSVSIPHLLDFLACEKNSYFVKTWCFFLEVSKGHGSLVSSCSLWLFEPRTSTHDCGGWYFERFNEEEPRGGSPFARLQANAFQEGLSYIESKQGVDSRSASNPSVAHKASYLDGSQKHFSSEKGWWDSSDGVSRVNHNHLRFEWPSNKVNGGLVSADASSRTTARHAKPLDPAVYIMTAAYLTLEKEEGTRTMRPSTVANLLDKGAKWTGELRSWWQKMAGV
jgi:hypothetical protein